MVPSRPVRRGGAPWKCVATAGAGASSEAAPSAVPLGVRSFRTVRRRHLPPVQRRSVPRLLQRAGPAPQSRHSRVGTVSTSLQSPRAAGPARLPRTVTSASDGRRTATKVGQPPPRRRLSGRVTSHHAGCDVTGELQRSIAQSR